MGGYAPDGNYYGSESLGPGEVEWLDPREAPLDVEEMPLPEDPEADTERTYFTEPYTGIVGGMDYGGSKVPGSDPYAQSHGKLTPLQVACPKPQDGGCGASIGDKCTRTYESVSGQMGARKRETLTGTRKVACLVRQKKADKS